MAAIDPSIFEYINVTSTDGKNTINIAGGYGTYCCGELIG